MSAGYLQMVCIVSRRLRAFGLHICRYEQAVTSLCRTAHSGATVLGNGKCAVIGAHRAARANMSHDTFLVVPF